MSGGSSSKSTSQTSTTTVNNSLQGIDGDAIVINGNENTLTDHGAVEKALDTTQHIYDETIDLIRQQNANTLKYGEDATENALDFASNISKPSDERTTDSIIKYTGIALIGVVVSKAFNRAVP